MPGMPDMGKDKGGRREPASQPPKQLTGVANECSCGQKFTSKSVMQYHKERTGHA